MPHGEILKILVKGAGTEFNPDLVKGFITMLKEWEERIVVADGEEPVPDA
jgi:response regulator RpfG family c-di-GMP phosphodiesterase